MANSFKKVPKVPKWIYKTETLEQRLKRCRYDQSKEKNLEKSFFK